MRNMPATALAIALCLPAAAISAQRTRPAEPSAQSFPGSEASPVRSIHGSIVRVDEGAHLVTVRDDAGKEVTIARTDFTRLNGDQIRVGNTVWLDMTEQGDRRIATSITIQARKPY